MVKPTKPLRAKRDPSMPPNCITTFDRDTIETVGFFKGHRGYQTWSEAIEKLIAKARESGLHLEAEQPASSVK